MHIKAKTRGFTLSKALGLYVKNKLESKLGNYQAKISRAYVTLLDINGPKGGEDMQCKIQLKLDNSQAIVVQETASNMYDAINTCSTRARQVVGRHFSRIRQQRKSAANYAALDG